MKSTHYLFAFLLLLFTGYAQQPQPAIPPDVQEALASISEDSLRGHLSFIASDLLEGRATPSKGLDIAAEYIAAQFRRAGLEPVGDDGYFQTANLKVLEAPILGFEFKISTASRQVSLPTSQISFQSDRTLALRNVAVIKLNAAESSLDPATTAELSGKVVIAEQRGRAAGEAARRLAAFHPALICFIDRSTPTGRGFGPPRLVDPQGPPRRGAGVTPPVIMLHGTRVGAFYDSLPFGETPAKVSVKVPQRVERPANLRNVIGLMRGSDPVLSETYVLVTAHYDHLGARPDQPGDFIFNGANDDGSGTVSVIELASALTRLKTKPRRSVVFMTVFGEELGLLGSQYYGRNPIFPLAKTVADINLEQVGRTDSTEGSQVNRASLTGFDFSDIGPIFKRAGELTGIEVYKHEKNSDAFFARSDNQALADVGVPAHTLCVAFVYPDYHQVGDHWDKIDYPNLARTDRMVALALWMIATSEEAPKWNEANTKTQRYVEAWKRLQGR